MFTYAPGQNFHQFLIDNNLPLISFHALRHTNASLLANLNVPVANISKRLGHSTVSTTLDIYTHAFRKADIDAADKLQESLAPKKPKKNLSK
jgi:integrase